MPIPSPRSAANIQSSEEMNFSQPPICTPVDQLITPSGPPSTGPMTPKRVTAKRSRIQKPSRSRPAVTLHNPQNQLPTAALSLFAPTRPHRPPLLPQHPLPPDDDSFNTMHTASASQSLSQRDLPEFSQDTLALLPNIVSENQRNRTGRAALRSRNEPQGLPPAAGAGHSGSSGLVRASLISAISNSTPMTNPFLPSERSGVAKAMPPPPVPPPRFQNASESFQDFDMVLGNADDTDMPPALNLSGAAVPRAQSSASFNANQLRSLKLLLVSGAQARAKSLDFEVHEVAGKGAFSEVTRATSRTDGCVYALKKNSSPLTSDKLRLDALQEILALSALQGHANILRYHDAWFEDRGKSLVLQTEYLSSGNLHALYTQRQTPMSVSDIRLLALDVSSALAHMHDRDIAHLDVKPDNIFKADRGIGRASFVIGDFGLACHKDGKDARTTEGDSRYLCPEALGSSPMPAAGCAAEPTIGTTLFPESNTEVNLENEDPNVGSSRTCAAPQMDLRKADVFSLGASLYELALGTPLDKAGPGWHRLRNRPDDVARDVARTCQSQALADIVRRMIEPDPHMRASARTIVEMCREADPAMLEQRRREDELRRENIEQRKRLDRFEEVMKNLLAQGEEGRKRLRTFSRTERREYVTSRGRHIR